MSENSDSPSTTGEQSVTRWISALRDGDHVAAENLWTFLRRRLIAHAQRTILAAPAAYDEEDVALSAFNALCDGLQKGRYEEVGSRKDLWKLLAVITVNKARKRAVYENRLKRGGDFLQVRDSEHAFELLVASDPPPELCLSMREECEALLNALPQEELKLVVFLKVEGYTNEEIAKTMGCTRRSIQRRLALIRDIWTDHDRD